MRHFLELDRISPWDLRRILQRAEAHRMNTSDLSEAKPLAGRTLALIFEKPSTRTRVSFEVAMRQLGGDVVVLEGAASQLGRGESVGDTARVLSRYVDIILMRTDNPDKLEELAQHANVPVINGLTARSHPCQLMADILTFEQYRGGIAGHKIAWLGDGNNVAATWIQAAVQFDFHLSLACPEPLAPPAGLLEWAKQKGAAVEWVRDPVKAAERASAIVTDCWISMHDDGDGGDRHNLLRPYQVDRTIMAKAAKDSLFMHCLPAHRGEEVTAEVLDGPQSVVWDEAENRLHAQKAILTWCLERL